MMTKINPKGNINVFQAPKFELPKMEQMEFPTKFKSMQYNNIIQSTYTPQLVENINNLRNALYSQLQNRFGEENTKKIWVNLEQKGFSTGLITLIAKEGYGSDYLNIKFKDRNKKNDRIQIINSEEAKKRVNNNDEQIDRLGNTIGKILFEMWGAHNLGKLGDYVGHKLDFSYFEKKEFGEED